MIVNKGYKVEIRPNKRQRNLLEQAAVCGLEIGRDLNAAINLKRYGEFRRSLYKQKACGEERLQFSDFFREFTERCSSEKQEGNGGLHA